jgi:hypothetical protein
VAVAVLFLVVGLAFVDGLALISLSIVCAVAAAIVLFAATRVAPSESQSAEHPEREVDGPPVG